MKMKALDALAKRIVPVPSSQVCIAYGNWSYQAGIKGHPSAPIKGFARALQKRATVVPMDEYKTTKLCSLCHDTLEKACLLATNDDGEFELRRTEMSCAVPTVLSGPTSRTATSTPPATSLNCSLPD
jgi:hypothetical protein